MLASARPLPERISLLRPTAVRGEPDFKTQQHIVEACTRALANGRITYPDNRADTLTTGRDRTATIQESRS